MIISLRQVYHLVFVKDYITFFSCRHPLAKQLGLNHLGTWCIRKIEPYIKFFNVEVDMIEEAGEGLKRYHGHFKDTGKKALFSPRSRNSAGKIVYMVTWEI